MKFACITNTQGIDVVERMGLGYHLALGQHLVVNNEYRNFYRRRHELGHFIIVDNGAAEPKEERLPFPQIVTAAMLIDADEIVLPDVLRDSEATLTASMEYKHMVPPCKRLVIPQGDSWDEWRYCLERFEEKIVFATIGVAKHLERLPGGRAQAMSILHELGFDIRFNIHFFGVWERPLTETAVAVEWGIRGIDTAAPMAYAQNFRVLNDLEHFSFQWSPSAGLEDRLFEINIERMLSACKRKPNAHHS